MCFCCRINFKLKCEKFSFCLELVREMLNCVGLVEEVPESHMDAVTGLSGNGPAYVRK